MTQEINIDITLTIEADVEQTKNGFENFVRQILTSAEDSEKFSFNKYHIKGVKEESEIYAPDPMQDDGVWDFVEKYYPKYYSCNEIMRNDDLSKIVNGELCGDAERVFTKEFGENLELAIAAFDQSCKYVYERAIAGYQQEQCGKISIVWSLEDVEMQAKNKGYILKHGEAQKILDMLKDKHDCNIGITWDVIDDYLSYIAPDSEQDDGIEWMPMQFRGKE
jgi:hypothetical protein